MSLQLRELQAEQYVSVARTTKYLRLHLVKKTRDHVRCWRTIVRDLVQTADLSDLLNLAIFNNICPTCVCAKQYEWRPFGSTTT